MLVRVPGRGNNHATLPDLKNGCTGHAGGNEKKGGYMKSLQLLAGITVLALSVWGCSTTNAPMGMPTLSGEPNPNTGKYTPPPSPIPPPRT
jgi:hypothetical protein